MVDTCHAASLFADLRSPGVLAIGSSAAAEDSISVSARQRVMGRQRVMQRVIW